MKVLLGMSGGVDSTCAALELAGEGHDVVGAVLVMHDHTDTAAARDAARSVGIPLIEVDCREAFSKTVESYFANEYLSGRTPNPCVVCNSEVKFRYLYERAMSDGFDAIATGHYAGVASDGGRYFVTEAEDPDKDQSYVLYRLPQSILSKLLLPLGKKRKKELLRRAKEIGLPSAYREESQEICFIPDGSYVDYIEERYGKCPPGDFLDGQGRVLGRHNGVIRYTVGQRKGLGIALGERMCVRRIDPVNNTVELCRPSEESVSCLYVRDMVFSGIREDTSGALEATVRLRYHAPKLPCRAVFDGGAARIELMSPARVAAPGQSAVIYLENRIAAGGFIV